MASDLSTIETMISEAMQQAIGDPVIAGMIVLFFFIILIAVLKLDMGVALVIIIPLIFVLATAGLLPGWIAVFGVLVMGYIIWLALKKATLTQR